MTFADFVQAVRDRLADRPGYWAAEVVYNQWTQRRPELEWHAYHFDADIGSCEGATPAEAIAVLDEKLRGRTGTDPVTVASLTAVGNPAEAIS